MPRTTTSEDFGKAARTKIQQLVMWVLGWTHSEMRVLPERFGNWVIGLGFVTGQEPDYAAFAAWVRNSLLGLATWSVLFELFSMILGHASGNPTAFGVTLTIGIVLFLGTWILLLGSTVGRMNGRLNTIAIGATAVLTFIFVGGPLIELFAPGKPLTEFWANPALHKPVLYSIASGWAVLGFALMCIFLLPLLWTISIGPFLLALAAQTTANGVKEVFTLVQSLWNSDSEEALAALDELKKRAVVHIGLLEKLMAILAVLATALFVNPTVGGLVMALAIAMVSVVVIYIRDAGEFRGTFFRKVIYGIASGALITLGTFYAVKLLYSAFVATWALGPMYFISLLVAVLAGFAGAVYVTFTSVTGDEQAERRLGLVDIRGYQLELDHFDNEGKPVFKKVLKVLPTTDAHATHDSDHPSPQTASGTSFFRAFQTGFGKVVGIVVALIGIVFVVSLVLFLLGPALNIDLINTVKTTNVVDGLTNPNIPVHTSNVLWTAVAIGGLALFLAYKKITEKG